MGELFIIFSFVLVMVVLSFAFGSSIHKRQIAHRERIKLAHQKSENDSENYRKLEERVRVLERIATDDNPRLAQQIEELRDLDQVELNGEKAQ